MKFGYCVNMIAQDKARTGHQWIPALKRAGFDYVELPLAQLMAMPEQDFLSGPLAMVEKNDFPCLCCNNFFPATYRLTGPHADHEEALGYAASALKRSAMLGAKRVVFGSSGARNMPTGFPLSDGLHQLSTLLKQLGDIAHSHNITVVIEPLNISESNIIHRFSEAAMLSRQVDHPRVKALMDSYHMRLACEPWDSLLDGKGLLKHVHVARPLNRSLPAPLDGEDYQAMFRCMKAIGYDDTLSIEAYLQPEQGADDLANALAYLRAQAI